MTTRRTFIKSLAIGTAALSAPRVAFAGSPGADDISAGKWDCSFDPSTSEMTIEKDGFRICGELSFESGGTKWSTEKSRDGVPGRNVLIDPKGNVQGYWIPLVNSDAVEIIFYHRSAQNFRGTLTFNGTVRTSGDSFACRSVPGVAEKVLNLSSGGADSLSDDSIFRVDDDALLQLRAAEVRISHREEGLYVLKMSGRIDSAAEASFRFEVKGGYFGKRWVPYYKPLSLKGNHKVPTGWMSWNTYFDKATAEDNLTEARIGRKYLQPFGCEIWHIESWQGNSDKLPVSSFHNMNLEVNAGQFPEGMKALADDIRALGFKPGIWLAPFGTGNSDFYREHTDWFLHRADGSPISCWNGKYTLDPTVPEALRHVEAIFRTASRDWGYDYFKVDGMSGRGPSYCAHLYERDDVRKCFRNPSCPNPFELCVQAIRRGIGEDKYMLACQGHATGPEATYAQASRLGADIVHPNCPVVWEGVMNQARCFLNQAFSHNIVMICDPDTLLVRDLPMEQARVSATVIALPGQLTFFGDKLAGLPAEKMKILQQVLPVTDVRPKSLYPYFEMLPVWNLGIDNGLVPPYNVVAFFNWSDSDCFISASCAELGIPEGDYRGLEFWTQKVWGFAEGVGGIGMDVPAKGVRVVSLHRASSVPQWLGSDRHVTMNGVEVLGVKSSECSMELSVHLVGGFPLETHFALPEGFGEVRTFCRGARITVAREELFDGGKRLSAGVSQGQDGDRCRSELTQKISGSDLRVLLESTEDADVTLRLEFFVMA